MHRSKKPEQIVTISLLVAELSLLLSPSKSIGTLPIPLHKEKPFFPEEERLMDRADEWTRPRSNQLVVN